MTATAAWLALSLATTGCSANVALERDLSFYGVWAKRGQVVGDYAHLYCEQGALRERDMFMWAVERAAYPAIVSIRCEAGRGGPPTEPPARP